MLFRPLQKPISGSSVGSSHIFWNDIPPSLFNMKRVPTLVLLLSECEDSTTETLQLTLYCIQLVIMKLVSFLPMFSTALYKCNLSNLPAVTAVAECFLMLLQPSLTVWLTLPNSEAGNVSGKFCLVIGWHCCRWCRVKSTAKMCNSLIYTWFNACI